MDDGLDANDRRWQYVSCTVEQVGDEQEAVGEGEAGFLNRHHNPQ